MMRSLFVDRGVLESRVAVIEDGRVAEVHIERSGAEPMRGQIRCARVTHISADLQAATVDVGDGVSLFLRAQDARVLAPADAQGRIPIGKLLTRGQTLLVQPTRPATDGKQGRCTADIALFGRYLTLYPLRTGVEAGKGGVDPELVARLEGLSETARVLLRPAHRRVPADLVMAEADRLLADWTEIGAGDAGKPGRIRDAQPLMARALTDLAGPDPEAILTPDRGMAADLRQMAAQLAPDLSDRIELTDARRSIDLDDEIEAALLPEAVFDGGRMTVEPTRAMTVIDIDGQGAPQKVNMAAVPEIARQIRLRRIGGQVAIDFVTLNKPQDRKRVETALRQALQRAGVQAETGGIDRFGILTLAVRREGASLADELAEVTPPGLQFRTEAQLARVLRRAALELAGVGPLPMVVEVSEQLQAAAPDDLSDQLSQALSRPLTISFVASGIDDMRLSRNR